MNLKDILLKKLDSILNPKLENRVILGFISIGTLLIGVPSILAYNAVLSIEAGSTTFTAEISNGPNLIFIGIGFLCLISAALFFYRKQQAEYSNAGAMALEENLYLIMQYLESRLSLGAAEIEGSERNKISQAKIVVERALNHTRYYIREIQLGGRNRETERELSDEWLEVGGLLDTFRIPGAGELHSICFMKSRYWADPDGWDESFSEGRDISLDSVKEKIRKIINENRQG